MIVLIRADATIEIGSGHVMRCAALGMRLMAYGASVQFVSICLSDRLADWLRDRGFSLAVLPAADITDWRSDLAATCEVIRQIDRVDLLIVDHYGLERAWEAGMRPHVQRILVIDDLADRDHDCDLLLDQDALIESDSSRYSTLVPVHCHILRGPRYALLRPEFSEMRKILASRPSFVGRLLVFFGGSDLPNETAKAIQALLLLSKQGIRVDVVIGEANKHRQEISYLCEQLSNATLHVQVQNMAELMAIADVAIGAGGSTVWERCCMGLPSLVTAIADNQEEVTATLAKLGVIDRLQAGVKSSVDDYVRGIESMLVDVEGRRRQSEQCLTLVDGEGAARVAMAIVSDLAVSTHSRLLSICRSNREMPVIQNLGCHLTE